ncbi:MAG: glycosyltransferase [Acidimicrobiia bacterium]|nr:glycosyltransferase [Acidimicrobiia bacterium]
MRTDSFNDIPLPSFDHLRHMTSSLGLWEHARYTTPRSDHGYCTDDNARALLVISRQPEPTADLIELGRIYMNFVQAASLSVGGFHNRRRADGSWADAIGSDDSQGRAIWALGVAARLGPEEWVRDAARELFDAQDLVSDSPRANAYAVLGAAEVLGALPDHLRAQESIASWVRHLRIGDNPSWPWPESRLAYDNARIPGALIAAGTCLGDQDMVSNGIRLLDWLVSTETRDGHFSFAPASGWALGEPRPGFDQQPLEATAFADACVRAWEVTGDEAWIGLVLAAARWLMGDNDVGAILYDAETGGGFDGLTPTGVNLNQGAESTLAALSTLQTAAKVRAESGITAL